MVVTSTISSVVTFMSEAEDGECGVDVGGEEMKIGVGDVSDEEEEEGRTVVVHNDKRVDAVVLRLGSGGQ